MGCWGNGEGGEVRSLVMSGCMIASGVVPCGCIFDAFGEQIIKKIERIGKTFFFSPKALTNKVRRTQISLIINN